VLTAYRHVIVPEMNLGQLSMLLRATFLVDIQSHTSVRGLPFSAADLEDVIQKAVTE
jgi:2-oxoglutarate ferredoxin oxidoreductase subunit alpha